MNDVAPTDGATVTEGEIGRLVDRFYARVRQDEVLGPVFNPAVSDWPEHLQKLTDFWSSIMLTSGKYHGNPMAAHYKHLAKITPAMFDRWLALWFEATAETVPLAAPQLQNKAMRIAESLKMALFFRLPAAKRPAAAA
jgi:hemoglobin